MRSPALLAVLLTVAAAGGCTGDGGAVPAPSPPAVVPPAAPAPVPGAPVVYAYAAISEERVFLVRDGRIAASMPGSYPAFTESGRYLVTSSLERIFAMDVATGGWHERRLSFVPPRGCAVSRSLVGDSLMLVAPTLQRIVLPELTASEPVAAALPPRLPGCVVGAVRGDPVVLVSNRHGRQLYRVGAGGATRRIGPDPMAPPGFESAPGEVRFSIAGPARLSYSVPDESRGDVVHVLDLDSGRDTVPATGALGLPGPSRGIYLADMWWSSTGMLHATMTSVRAGELPDVATRQLWRVAGGAWEPVNRATWDQVRELPGGGRLIIMDLGSRGGDGPGRYGLYQDGRGGGRLITTDAAEVVTPPVPVAAPPSLSEPFRPRVPPTGGP